jgi:hypothetical protein
MEETEKKKKKRKEKERIPSLLGSCARRGGEDGERP